MKIKQNILKYPLYLQAFYHIAMTNRLQVLLAFLLQIYGFNKQNKLRKNAAKKEPSLVQILKNYKF